MVVVFDVTSSESYGNVKRWLHEIETNCENVHKVLVGNKVDEPERRVVSAGDARRFADSLHISYFETSAKENINVEQVLLVPLAHRRRRRLTPLTIQMFNCVTELVLEAKLRSQQSLGPGAGNQHGDGRGGGGLRLDGRHHGQGGGGGGKKGCKCG